MLIGTHYNKSLDGMYVEWSEAGILTKKLPMVEH